MVFTDKITLYHDVTEAIAKLQGLVRQYPDYLLARKSLIKLLLREGGLEQAQEQLKVALYKRPRNVDLIELQARIYFLQGNYKQALTELQRIPAPPLKTSLDYYALIAALQQHLGRPMLAAQLYQQLLVVEPDNSVWWMGLGIAYEAANRPNSAVDAYRKALSTGGLNPNLHAFVATRMTELSD